MSILIKAICQGWGECGGNKEGGGGALGWGQVKLFVFEGIPVDVCGNGSLLFQVILYVIKNFPAPWLWVTMEATLKQIYSEFVAGSCNMTWQALPS